MVRRDTSTTFPLKTRIPPACSTTAATASSFSRRARNTASPRRIACVTVCRMPHSLTSRPVRGALHVAATEPTSVHTLRLSRSIHFQLATRETTTALSRTSASVRGYG